VGSTPAASTIPRSARSGGAAGRVAASRGPWPREGGNSRRLQHRYHYSTYDIARAAEGQLPDTYPPARRRGSREPNRRIRCL